MYNSLYIAQKFLQFNAGQPKKYSISSLFSSLPFFMMIKIIGFSKCGQKIKSYKKFPHFFNGRVKAKVCNQVIQTNRIKIYFQCLFLFVQICEGEKEERCCVFLLIWNFLCVNVKPDFGERAEEIKMRRDLYMMYVYYCVRVCALRMCVRQTWRKCMYI